LIKAKPSGAVCHTGADTCFNEENVPLSAQSGDENFLFELERIILDRKANPGNDSYTSKLFAKGLNKIAQKVGEEAVELVIEAKDDDAGLFKSEAADLLYHMLVLFAEKNIALADVLETLRQRRR
jgi:phosphoribosyl-ATP pyrophosphohydrolase/phosphoribosyl-AMP cyclohydrolase